MKVAIDKGPLLSGHKVRGIGVQVAELTKALKKEAKNQKKIKVESVDFSTTSLSHFDIVHFQAFSPFFVTLPKKRLQAKTLATIDDLIQLIFPRQYAPGLRGSARFLEQKRRLRLIDGILTISDTSKKDIIRFLKVPEEKVFRVYLAPKKVYRQIKDTKKLLKISKKYNLPKEFVLYVGDVNFNKNILALVKAAKKINMPLVIAGKQALDIEKKGLGLELLEGPKDWMRFLFGKAHPELAHHEALVKGFKNKGKVIRLGFIPDEDLVLVYNLATVYCQPSFYEGFGLPIIEAMASGTPVIASEIGAHKEVAGKAALFFDPKNYLDLAFKLEEVRSNKDKRQELSKKGLKQAKKFSWEKTAKEVFLIYKKLLNEE